MLNNIEFFILDSVVDCDMPFEFVDSTVKDIDQNLTPQDTVNTLYKLYKLGFIKISQIPIRALKQGFIEKIIHPNEPSDLMGDLSEFFNEYCKIRTYLWYLEIGSKGGVPFGVWIDLTDLGRQEWNKDIYKKYYS